MSETPLLLTDEYLRTTRTSGMQQMPLLNYVADYARRLLKACQLSRHLLEFVLSALDSSLRRELRETFCKERERDSVIRWRGCDSDSVADALMQSVFSKENDGNKERLEQRLRSRLERMLNKFVKQEDEGAQLLQGLAKLLSIGKDDLSIVKMIYCWESWHPLYQFIEKHCAADRHVAMSIMTNIPLARIKTLLRSKGRLIECGILTYRFRDGELGLSHEVREYLSGTAGGAPFEKSCKKVVSSSVPLDQFGLTDKTLQILRAMVSSSKPCNILFYGQSGTGKTELARSLVCGCGKEALFTQFGERGENDSRRVVLEATVAMASPESSVIVVDEADTFLNTHGYFWSDNSRIDKGWLNDFLERLKVTTIWISNSVSSIEESTLRRFAYGLEFKSFTPTQRRGIWEEHLKGHPLKSFISHDMVKRLSVAHRVNAAGIKSALDAARCIIAPDSANPESVESVLKELLERHESLTCGGSRQKNLPLTSRYDTSCLNTDVSTGTVLESVRGYSHDGPPKAEKPAMNILFWGMAGTGKTEFAKYLAHELERVLIVKRASDLLDMYVGGTEKNIRDAFSGLRDSSCILLLDEADSFLIRRETAVRSWEVSQTNELLTQIENHHGILICCTNLLENLDSAVMRRFVWKVKFMPLTEQGRFTLYERYFGAAISVKLKGRLARIPDLTAGDFKTVWHRMAASGASTLNHDLIVEALELEARYKEGCKGNRIGF